MHHARDAEDSRLWDEGNIAALLAKYDPVIVGRCVARLLGHADADDVAQDVKLRLLAEFRRGKTYGETPYRVVVHNVVTWTLADYFAGRPTDVPLPEGWETRVEDWATAVDSRYHLVALFDSLPARTRRVLELRYLVGLTHEEIAEHEQMTRNAVDQALHRGHEKLTEALASG